MEIVSFANFRPLFFVTIACFIVLSSSYSYIQTEILSKEFGPDFTNICQKKTSELRYYKVLSIEQKKNTSKIMCIYDDSKKNEILTLNKLDTWKIINIKSLNDFGQLYWPIYL